MADDLVFLPLGDWRPDRRIGADLRLVRNLLPVASGWRTVEAPQLVRALQGDGASVDPYPVVGAHEHLFPASQSSQKARPIADLATTGWVRGSGEAGALYQDVDEDTFSDADLIRAHNPSGSGYRATLGAVADPASSSGHVFSYRYAVYSPSGAWTLVFRLWQDLTEIAAWTESGSVEQALTTVERALTGPQTDTITDYAGLWEEVVATVPGVAQVVRPVADVSPGGYLTQAGGSSNLYQAIDEAVTSDADYVESPVLGEAAAERVYRFRFAAAVEPTVDQAFPVTVRAQGVNSGVRMVVRVYDGNGALLTLPASEASRTWTVTSSFADYVVTLSAAEVALIQNWQLEVEVRASYPSHVASVSAQSVRPTADVTVAGWYDHVGAVIDLWKAIDEAVVDLADYVEATAEGPLEYEASVGGGVDPQTNREHKVRVHFLQSAANVGDLVVRLRESGTQRWQDNLDLRHTSPQVFSIPEALIAPIAGYDLLSLELVTSAKFVHRIYRLELEVPTPRRLRVSQAYANVTTAARAEVTWLPGLRCPVVTGGLQGDLPTLFVGTRAGFGATGGVLYTADKIAGFSDVGRAADYDGEKSAAWRFASFGPHVVATNNHDEVQQRVNNAGAFQGLMTTGSSSSSTDRPRGRFLAVIGQFLFLACLHPSQPATGRSEDEMQCSAFGNINDFVPSVLTGATRFTLRGTPGGITGLVGGEQGGFVFKRGSIHAVQFVSGSVPFRIDPVPGSVGTSWPSSIVSHGDWHYFYAGGGKFWRVGPGGVEPVAETGVGDWFYGDTDDPHSLAKFNPGELIEEDLGVVGFSSSLTGKVFWLFRRRGDPTVYAKTGALVLDVESGRFSLLAASELSSSFALGHRRPDLSSPSYLADLSLFHFFGTSEFNQAERSGWSVLGGPGVLEAEVETNVLQVYSDAPVLARVVGVLPVISHSGTVLPYREVTVTSALDPVLSSQAVSTVVASTDVTQDGFFPTDQSGDWWRLRLLVPANALGRIDGLPGFYVRAQRRGVQP
jgi:hypothetical protein